MQPEYHVPVMLRESVDLLITDPDGVYIDGTLGGGGHSAAILERLGERGRLYAFDADPGALTNAQTRFGEDLGRRLHVRQAYFSQAVAWLEENGIAPHGVLLDLGISSRQIDSDQIGLSYRMTMPLDMRFDRQSGRPSARSLVTQSSREDLATLLRRFGEEPAAWKIAGAIVDARSSTPIQTTTELREIIASVIPERFLMATLSRVFQALRIAVNDELGELETALSAFTRLLLPGGRFVVLTYHSLEDRLVKDRFREESRSCVCPPEIPVCRCDKVQRMRVLIRKPMVPASAETARNPRARSAKLRAAERVAESKRSWSDGPSGRALS